MFVICLSKGMLGFYFSCHERGFFWFKVGGFGLFVSYVGKEKVDGLVLGKR